MRSNNAVYALERQHIAEVEDGRESSAWNEETQDWDPIKCFSISAIVSAVRQSCCCISALHASPSIDAF